MEKFPLCDQVPGYNQAISIPLREVELVDEFAQYRPDILEYIRCELSRKYSSVYETSELLEKRSRELLRALSKEKVKRKR